MYSVDKILTWTPSVVLPEQILSGRFSWEFWLFLWNTCWLWKGSSSTPFWFLSQSYAKQSMSMLSWEYFQVEVNFLNQNIPSSFQTSIGTFNKVSRFSQHTIKTSLCIRFTWFVSFHTKWSQRVGWVTNKIVSYFLLHMELFVCK